MAGLGIGKGIGLCIGLRLGLGLQSGLIFMLISQTAYLIYRYSVNDAEYKSHLGKKFAVTSSLNGLIGPTKHRLLINHF